MANRTSSKCRLVLEFNYFESTQFALVQLAELHPLEKVWLTVAAEVDGVLSLDWVCKLQLLTRMAMETQQNRSWVPLLTSGPPAPTGHNGSVSPRTKHK